ncbi:hypothetical protein RGQ15_10875 [Paracoccus sp. MBLB3053]|uniref:Uncharacterized protein n=1 Tax=Paracoccus aurantius TaxID=3073814 RepID=A0ABU2HU08_9RHOB|nr:hypothetical protein [Paracoccus sp. MBLB3053]MDS9468069.1 hypothetical protein [Paracoccus sp. MBLB3053]
MRDIDVTREAGFRGRQIEKRECPKYSGRAGCEPEEIGHAFQALIAAKPHDATIGSVRSEQAADSKMFR